MSYKLTQTSWRQIAALAEVCEIQLGRNRGANSLTCHRFLRSTCQPDICFRLNIQSSSPCSGLPGLDQDFIDINSSQAFGGAVPGSSARRSGQGSEIRLNERGYGGVVPETTEDDDFDVLRSAGRRGRASDIELLRREETPAGGAGVRSSLSAGGLTGSSGAHDDDDRRSVVSDLDDSVRRRGVRADDTDPAARKKRASLAAAAINNELDGDEDKYGLGEAMGLGSESFHSFAVIVSHSRVRHHPLNSPISSNVFLFYCHRRCRPGWI